MAQRAHQRVDGHREPSLTQPPASLTTFRAAPSQPQAQGQADHRPGQHRARRDGSALPALVFSSLLGCGARGRAGRTRAPPPPEAPPPAARPEVPPRRARAAPRAEEHWLSEGARSQGPGARRHAPFIRAWHSHTNSSVSLWAVRPWSLPCFYPLPPSPARSRAGSHQAGSSRGLLSLYPQRWESLKSSPREPQDV